MHPTQIEQNDTRTEFDETCSEPLHLGITLRVIQFLTPYNFESRADLPGGGLMPLPLATAARKCRSPTRSQVRRRSTATIPLDCAQPAGDVRRSYGNWMHSMTASVILCPHL